MRTLCSISSILIATLLMISCGNDHKTTLNKQQQKKEITSTSSATTFEAGKLYNNIYCQNHKELSYAIYLPKSYSDTSLSAVIFLFDAHGRGSLPVKKYQAVADEFNLIIACSNDSKNGLSGEAINMISYNFIKDVLSRFKINNDQIFSGGFSGGARVAVQVADMDKQIKGVLGVGAGIPNETYVDKIDFNYFIAAGNKDFNYKELYDLAETLKSKEMNYYFMEFDGKHEWPEPRIVRTAMYFMMINNRDDIYSESDEIIKNYQAFEKENLQAAFNTNDLVSQVQIYERLTQILNKISNTIKYQKKLKILYTTAIYKHHLKNLKIALTYERGAQKPLANAIATQNTEWWNKKVLELEQKSSNSKSLEENLANQRLLNYLSLLSYMYADNALKNNQLMDAQKYLFIYEKVDPDNSEVYYLKAIYYTLQNNNSLAIQTLETAVSKGFEDFERIAKDPHFHFSSLEMEMIRKGK